MYTTRDTTLNTRMPQLKIANFGQEQLSPAAKEKADEPLGGDWEIVSRPNDKAETPRAGTGQPQPQLPEPLVPFAARVLLTTGALAEQQAMIGSVPSWADNVGHWARSQSCHGDSLDAARPQEGMPPADGVGHKAAEAERPRGHPKPPSSSRPSTNASEGFTPAEPLNQVDADLRYTGAGFDEPYSYPPTMLSLEELDPLPKKASGPRTGKACK